MMPNSVSSTVFVQMSLSLGACLIAHIIRLILISASAFPSCVRFFFSFLVSSLLAIMNCSLLVHELPELY